MLHVPAFIFDCALTARVATAIAAIINNFFIILFPFFFEIIG